MPISPARPVEMDLSKRQLLAFSRSGFGDVRRQLCLECHWARAITGLPIAPLRMKSRTKVMRLSARNWRPDWKLTRSAAWAALAIASASSLVLASGTSQ